MGLHKTFVKFLMNRTPSSSQGERVAGTGHKRAPEGEITKRASERSLFENRRSLTRPRLKKALQKDSGKVPGMGGYTRRQRMDIFEQDLSKEKYGTHFTPYELSKHIKELKKDVRSSSELGERARLRKKIKYFEELKGNKNEL